MAKYSSILSALGVGAMFACAPLAAQAQVPVAVAADQQALLRSTDAKLAANKKLVFDFWREVFIAHHMELTPKYMAEGYIQHNPGIPTGRAAFERAFGSRPRVDIPTTIPNLVTLRAEGDIVIVAFKRDMPEPTDPTKTYTTTWFDMFRIENGLIAEHWDYGLKAAPAPAARIDSPPPPR